MIPVILSGGSGTRLWPSSRSQYPKQYISLNEEKTMLQNSLIRLKGSIAENDPFIVCNLIHGHMVKSQLEEIGINPRQVILESTPRGTAPALTAALISALYFDPQAILLLLPLDHVMTNIEKFHQTLLKAEKLARKGLIVNLGIKAKSEQRNLCNLETIKSKTDIYYVNQILDPSKDKNELKSNPNIKIFTSTGILVGKGEVLLKIMQSHFNNIVDFYKKIITPKKQTTTITIAENNFPYPKSLSINKAIISNTTDSIVIPLDAGWSQLNDWSSLWEISKKDYQGNVINGDVIAINSQNNYIQNDTKLISIVGVDNLIIVEADNAILIADRQQATEIKKLVAQLKQKSRKEIEAHKRIQCTWGQQENLINGKRFQVQHIIINKKQEISMQKHHHKAKHWIVVKGTAMVNIEHEQILLTENQSVLIPIGTQHKLRNPGNIDLELIEIQSGSYLGEDDIIQIKGNFTRTI